MTWLIARRLAIFVASLAAASLAVFALLTLVGDPARSVLGIHATPEALQITRQRMGLDRPVWEQYWSWAWSALHGDLGTSYITHFGIAEQVGRRLLVTIYLVLGGMVTALIIAIPAGTLAAVQHRKITGTVVTALSQLGIAVPAFLAGIVLIALVSVKWGVLPAGGYVAPSADALGFVKRMLLPWLSLGLVQGAVLARYVRSALLDEVNADYIRTARSKGLTRTGAIVRHGLRNASIPVLTVLGVQLVTVLIGAVVVERVFALPGIGSFLVDSVARQDRLAVQGIVMIIVALSLAVSFVVDIAYVMIDPRLRRAR